jgi:REP element-mobilizing transposase RayT
MAHSLAEVYIHIVFSTKDRAQIIKNDLSARLHSYLGGICNGLNCTPLSIGGYEDHIHILCVLSKKTSIVELVENLKKQSSRWIKEQDAKYSTFYWQAGYGVFSVNKSQISDIRNYIENQVEHHKRVDFKQEYKAILDKLGVKYDERYLWI